MNQFLLYTILSIGAGAAYALLAQGIVVTYRGSGVLNFAQGGVAMFTAYGYYALTTAGIGRYFAVVIALLGAAIAGCAFFMLVLRPLRAAPVLAKVITTLALGITLEGAAIIMWGTNEVFVEPLFPSDSVELFAGGRVAVDRFYMFGLAALLAVGLWALYRFTTFGLATRAAAESERGASLVGYSPDTIGAGNWALGFTLAGLAGIAIAPISALYPTSMTLLVLPAMAAALVGRFTSIGITTAAALLIACAELQIPRYTDFQGLSRALPFIVVIVALAVTGKLIPQRGALIEGRAATALRGRVSLPTGFFAIAFVCLLIAALGDTYRASFTVSMVFAVIALSVTVSTGYLGQITLAPMMFAGLGALGLSTFADDLGIPFPLSVLVVALAVVPVGVVLGVPALRVRGLSLAVVTLGAAIAVNAMVFENSNLATNIGENGTRENLPVPVPSLGGWSLDPFAHSVRYGFFVLLALALAVMAVSNLRRSDTGRRMLAVRSNERAARAAGINVSATKVQGFALSASIAAAGGALLAYTLSAVPFASFGPQQSITLVMLVYIGGIAAISGALVAGLVASGGLLFSLLSGVPDFETYYAVVSGVALIVTVIAQPNGAAPQIVQQFHAAKVRFHRRGRLGSADVSARKAPGSA